MAEPSTRERIVRAAADLLTEGGREAVSTRAVSTAAGVQAPTIYRLFGDKQGLLDAVVTDAFERYLARKRALRPTGDPAADVRQGWDTHVAFARANPALYRLMWPAGHADLPPAAAQSARALREGFARRHVK